MFTYHRHFALGLLAPVLLITLALTAMVWLIRSMRFLDLIINNGLPIRDFIYLSSLLAPFFVMILLPISLFIAVIYLYHKLIIDSELIILKTAGLSNLSLSKPAVSVATLLMIATLFVSLYVAPKAYSEFKDVQLFFRNTSNLSLLQKGIFNTPMKGLTVYIDSKTEDGLLQGILVHDRNRDRPMTLIAKEGRLLKNDKGLFLDVVNGRQEISKENGDVDVLYFDSYFMDLTHYSERVTSRSKEAEERFLPELFNPESGIDEPTRLRFVAEGHHRIVWPLLCFTLTFVALSCLLAGQLNRRGQWRRILLAALSGLTLIVLDLTFKNLASTHPHLNVLMYLNALFPIAASIYMMRKDYRFVC